VIDFEYSGFNYLCFEVGNMFNEMAMDYCFNEYPFFSYDSNSIVKKKEQVAFMSEYFGKNESSEIV
jgi:thiamine kinase-like enzyme